MTDKSDTDPEVEAWENADDNESAYIESQNATRKALRERAEMRGKLSLGCPIFMIMVAVINHQVFPENSQLLLIGGVIVAVLGLVGLVLGIQSILAGLRHGEGYIPLKGLVGAGVSGMWLAMILSVVAGTAPPPQ